MVRSPHDSVSDLDAVSRSFSAGTVAHPIRLALASHPSKHSVCDTFPREPRAPGGLSKQQQAHLTDRQLMSLAEIGLV